MDRTAAVRAQTPCHPVFLSLRAPCHALSAATVASILEDGITRAGLGGQGFTAKCFHHTGATCAVSMGLDPDIARRIGRWRSREIFEKLNALGVDFAQGYDVGKPVPLAPKIEEFLAPKPGTASQIESDSCTGSNPDSGC